MESRLGARRITARIAMSDAGRRPRQLRIRLPHPGRVPAAVAGGAYDRRTESLRPVLVDGKAELKLAF